MATIDPPLPLSTTPAQSEPIPSTESTLPAAAKIPPEMPITAAVEEPIASSTKLPISDGSPAEEPSTEKDIDSEALAAENPSTQKDIDSEALAAENPSTTTEGAKSPTIQSTSTTADAENPIPATPEHIQDRGLLPPPTEKAIEESFYLKDLNKSQKKALLHLKAKIQSAIMDNTFLDPPKPVKTKKDDAKEEEKEEEAEEGEKTEGKTEQDGQEAMKPLTDTATDVGSSDEQTTTTSEVIPESTRDITPEPTPAKEICDEHVIPSAPSDESPSLDDLALWGIPLLHSKGDERTDVLLLKFLRARDYKAEKALNMLQDTMVWRKEFNTDGLLEEETPADFHGSFIHGMDRDGHPVCYNADLCSKKSAEDEAQLKKRIQVLEKGIQTLDFSPNGVHSMVQVIDFSGHSPAFLGRGVRSKILDLLQNNYPELVSKQIFINVPWYFPPLLSLFNPRTRSKAVLAKPGQVAETLFKYISPDQVPVQYGGLSRLNDTGLAGIEAPVTQVIVNAGEKQSIELPLSNAGKLVWDISVIGWEVLYDEEFVPDEGYIKIIRKSTRIAANEEPLRNTYIADEPGKMVLTINNTSRRRRVVVYRYAIIAS